MCIDDPNYLSPENPFLQRLILDYQECRIASSFWNESWRSRISLQNFRRCSDYLAQQANGNGERDYQITFDYLMEIYKPLLSWLTEDRLFGVTAYEIAGRCVTRDLLDSVSEIGYLSKIFSSRLRVLDIGAGYGRFAHRMTSFFPESYVFCADAVPESTFLCDYYIHFRKFEDRASAIPLPHLGGLQRGEIDLAINIHSWSECSLQAINFWLDHLQRLQVPYLFVVPHEKDCRTTEAYDRVTGGPSFLPSIRSYGYELLHVSPKYEGAMTGIYPAYYFLFCSK